MAEIVNPLFIHEYEEVVRVAGADIRAGISAAQLHSSAAMLLSVIKFMIRVSAPLREFNRAMMKNRNF